MKSNAHDDSPRFSFIALSDVINVWSPWDCFNCKERSILIDRRNKRDVLARQQIIFFTIRVNWMEFHNYFYTDPEIRTLYSFSINWTEQEWYSIVYKKTRLIMMDVCDIWLTMMGCIYYVLIAQSFSSDVARIDYRYIARYWCF